MTKEEKLEIKVTDGEIRLDIFGGCRSKKVGNYEEVIW
jgi:hypothetical protein